jgi:protein pelota
MRVLRRDPLTGTIKLRVENPDDLWHLYNLVAPGDLVRASTHRREEPRADRIRPERGERRRVTLGVRVDKVEFQEFSDRLRLGGVIEEGPQDMGSHHTFSIGMGDEVAIVKTWRPHELRRIEDAVAATERPLVSFLALDDEEAVLAQLRQYGVRELATIRAAGGGKQYGTGRPKDAYFAEIYAALKQAELGEALLVLGPGFEKESLAAYVRARDPALAHKIQVRGTGQSGMTGIQEALKSGLGSKVFEESRVAVETRAIEALFSEIAKEGSYAYGPDHLRRAVDAGAVNTLLVTEEAVRDPAVEGLMQRTEAARGKVLIVSTHHEAGKRLASLGGVAALLRYPMD